MSHSQLDEGCPVREHGTYNICNANIVYKPFCFGYHHLLLFKENGL